MESGVGRGSWPQLSLPSSLLAGLSGLGARSSAARSSRGRPGMLASRFTVLIRLDAIHKNLADALSMHEIPPISPRQIVNDVIVTGLIPDLLQIVDHDVGKPARFQPTAICEPHHVSRARTQLAVKLLK